MSIGVLARTRRLSSTLPAPLPPLARYIVLPFTAAGLTLLLSSILGLLEGDPYSYRFMAWGAGYVALSAAWVLATRPSYSLTREGAFVLVAFSWLATPLASALPIAYELHIPFIDAWFESISGYTTTGLSVFSGGVDRDYGVYIPRVEELPATVLWWRAVSEWLGGFGVVVLFYTIARLGGLPAHLVGAAEGRFERIEPSIAKSLQALMILYLVLTALGTSLLYAAGMSLSDALYHTMTGLATGGFSTHSESIGYYRSPVVEAATIVVMVLGASNFADLYAVLRGVRRRYSGEIPGLLGLIAFNTLVGVLVLYALNWSPHTPLREALFDLVSAHSGTGFGISDLSHAPGAYKFLLVLAMITGGSAFSTTGGIKVYRVSIVLKSVAWSVRETVYGRSYVSVKRVGGYAIDESLLQSAIAVILLFTLTLIAGATALMILLPGTSVVDALFEAQSALCTVGLSVGITSAAAPWTVKAVLMVLMTLGRLEVIGFIYAATAAAKLLKSMASTKPRKTPEPLRLPRRTYPY
ncbi:MAG: hypothetical protein DSY37_02285 [Hyperthermus sp.]|nr:MAG: hypothetical protein DSY37_02285 [Hyperthermus sp.]